MPIEYKAPHKFSSDNVVAGLDGEIRPVEDVINKEGESFGFNSKWLAAAAITQLFSDMIRKGVQWGYIFMGEAIIFLHISDDLRLSTTISRYRSWIIKKTIKTDCT